MEALSRTDTNNLPTVNGTDGREALPKFWIAAYTRPRSEKKAATEITRLGIETYVPVQSIMKQWSDRKKKIDVVVIPNIIFVKLSENEIITVKSHPLITSVIHSPGKKNYSIIPSYQIEQLKYMLNEADTPVIFNATVYKIDSHVRVKRGHLKGLIGAVEKISENKSRLIVSVDLLGGAMIEIDTSDLEAVEEKAVRKSSLK